MCRYTIRSDIDQNKFQYLFTDIVIMKIDIHTHILPKNWPNLKEVSSLLLFCNKEEIEPKQVPECSLK